MFTIIIIAVLVLVLVIATGVAIFADYDETKGFAAVIAIAAFVFAIGTVAFTSFAAVEAKQVGVITTWGKPAEQTLGSGPHWKAPWQKVTEIDATTQTDEYHGDSAINVILADKNTADISATIRWSVNKKNANDVYADFRSDDPTQSLRDAVVSTQFKAAVNAVFASYDATSTKPADVDTLAAEAQKRMLARTKGLVDIESVTISYIKPDKAVQKKINAIQAQSAKTRIADEQIATAKKEASANRELAASLRDPNVLVSKCLDIVAEGANLPAGFTCMGNSGAVVVPSR